MEVSGRLHGPNASHSGIEPLELTEKEVGWDPATV
jgi:hypothetical protein